jgi:hypothetical protein
VSRSIFVRLGIIDTMQHVACGAKRDKPKLVGNPNLNETYPGREIFEMWGGLVKLN